MVKLLCAVVGAAGSAFEVDIDEGASVSALKDAIKGKKPNDFKDIDADKLQLFLAKKGDAWLKDDDPAALELEEGKTHQDIQTVIHGDKMKATWTIEDVLTANNMTKRKGRAPKSKQIHVLVVLPVGAVGSASEASLTTQMAQEIHDLHEQANQKKRKQYVHSKMNSTQGRELLQNLNIQVDVVRTVPYAARRETQIDAFKWGSVLDECGKEIALTEEQQRERYRTYVEANIKKELIANQLCVVGVEHSENILTVEVGGRDIELKGRTDLLILSDAVKDYPSDARYLTGVKLLIEVKRAVRPSFDFQAMSELIALDLIVKYPVMALLTDLNGVWLFFWISEKDNDSARICKARIQTPGEAFEVIKTLLTQSPTADADIQLPGFQESVKRQKLAKVLPPVGEGGESGAIRESIERYYDIASILGPDIEMARAVARQVTRSIPTLSYFS